MFEPVAIGVDAGGTKTHVVISRADSTERDAVVPTRSWWPDGLPLDDPGNARRLIAALALEDADRLDPQAALVMGAHRVDSQSVATNLQAYLSEVFAGLVRVHNDALLIGPAAGITGPSVAVIAGTGSIVVALDGIGGSRRLGGYGHLLGDEGSAPALVRDLAVAITRGADRGEPDPIALGALARAAGVPEGPECVNDLATWMHEHPSRTDWGDLAPAVFDAAELGSPMALGVVGAHAAALAGLIAIHLTREPGARAVVLAGGVVTHQPRLALAITRLVHDQHPDLPVVILEHPPVGGAVTLARSLLRPAGGADVGSNGLPIPPMGA